MRATQGLLLTITLAAAVSGQLAAAGDELETRILELERQGQPCRVAGAAARGHLLAQRPEDVLQRLDLGDILQERGLRRNALALWRQYARFALCRLRPNLTPKRFLH